MKKYIFLISVLFFCAVSILILPAMKGAFLTYACQDNSNNCPPDPPPPTNNGGPGQEELNAIANCKATQNPCTLQMQIALIEAIYAHLGFTVTVTGPNSVHITCGNGASIDLTGPNDTPTPVVPTDTPIPPTPTTVPACGVACSSQTYCQSAHDGCTACLGGTCQTPPACGADCGSDSTMCLQNQTGCNSCLKNTSGVGPANTCQPPAACGADCTKDTSACSTVKDVPGCTQCLTDQSGNGTTKTCQNAPACGSNCTTDPSVCSLAGPGCNTCIGTPGSTTKVCGTPACGTDCSTDASVCAKSGACSQCVDEGNGVKQCAAPIACGTSCTSNPGICKQASGGCNVCFQGACTQDQFNPGMCTCDGTDTNVNTTIQINNQDVTITAFGKVSTANAGWAKIKDISFSLEKIGSTITEIAKSDPIPAVISQTTADKVQYKATWTIKLPSTVMPGDQYQVTAASNCQRQILASMTLARKPVKTVVLGIHTNIPILDHIIASVKHALGIKDTVAVLGAQNQLQIQSFMRVNVTKSCQSVNFQF